MSEPQIVRYRQVVEASLFDHAALDLRKETEDFMRKSIGNYCRRHGIRMAGPVLLQWTCQGSVRTEPVDGEVAE